MAREVKDRIIQCINENRSFVLEAGAGAGKTHTLMETINYIQNEFTNKSALQPNILCITFTNVAKNEIRERINSLHGLTVNTMHEFLWDFIKQFQVELKNAIIDIIEEEKSKINEDIRKAEKLIEKPRRNTKVDEKKQEIEDKKEKLKKYTTINLNNIRYEGYRALYKGVISHKDIIDISIRFLKNKTFAKIFINSFTHIFIDEFQDTDRGMLHQLMDSIKTHKEDNYLVLGLFGDRMQQIYSSSPLEIDYAEYQYEVIPKLDNYRSCQEIILANNILRNDGLHQEYKNENIKFENMLFVFNVNKDDLYLKEYIGEDLSNYQRLFLSHKEISEELGFKNISQVFTDEYGHLTNDKLLKLEDTFLYYLIETILPMTVNFINGNHQLILQHFSRDTFVMSDLLKLREELKEILHDGNQLGQVLKGLNDKELINPNKVQKIIKDYEELGMGKFIQNLMEIKLGEYLRFYNQVNNETHFQTLHGVKGDEFDKVVINIRHQQSWKTYNFDSLFLEGVNESTSNQNAHKLFYVACTRAKSALIINYISDTTDEDLIEAVCKNIRKMFGNFIKTAQYKNKVMTFNPEQLV